MSGLEDFYRSKDVYIKLPTQLRYYKHRPKLSSEGELGIMPMSTKDEMLLKVPDTLYNGEALFEIIKSVAPDIKDPYEILLPDMDAILIATRIASYGTDMDVSATCPHCNQKTEYAINLANILSGLRAIDPLTIEINKLSIILKPNSVSAMTAKGIADHESNRLLIIMSQNKDSDTDLYKDQFKESLERISAANIAFIANRIESVTTPDDTVVTDVQEIANWLTNATTSTVEQISNHGDKLNDSGIPKSFNFTCSNEVCQKSFESSFEFNPSFFFKDS